MGQRIEALVTRPRNWLVKSDVRSCWSRAFAYGAPAGCGGRSHEIMPSPFSFTLGVQTCVCVRTGLIGSLGVSEGFEVREYDLTSLHSWNGVIRAPLLRGLCCLQRIHNIMVKIILPGQIM